MPVDFKFTLDLKWLILFVLGGLGSLTGHISQYLSGIQAEKKIEVAQNETVSTRQQLTNVVNHMHAQMQPPKKPTKIVVKRCNCKMHINNHENKWHR